MKTIEELEKIVETQGQTINTLLMAMEKQQEAIARQNSTVSAQNDTLRNLLDALRNLQGKASDLELALADRLDEILRLAHRVEDLED